ncbi:MAG TPA: hypothetical protein DHW61_11205 [Lachnoclostridium phytofermentans]|uniref:BIG2 domain-containing protein n=1 Tax=Lachnoclostridium phytofermentans TaxID=66219 RepID=A0A3D2X892_9FIRM|nr:Ig-like domain-containing protein [Lachnoclostridium sp.]HCL02957.1 hypothetical protein [Lachnoclostridium phytofermentans]
MSVLGKKVYGWEDVDFDLWGYDDGKIFSYTIEPGKSKTKKLHLAAGGYYFQITPSDDLDYKFTIEDISVYATAIKLKEEKFSLAVGDYKILKYTTTPSGTCAGNIKWSSDNKKVATVSETGEVKGIALGQATITGELEGGNKVKCKVTVNSMLVHTSANSNPKLNAVVGTENKNVSWSSSDKAIATVTSAGKVTTKDINGEVKIVATVDNVKYTYQLLVTNYYTLAQEGITYLKSILKKPKSLQIHSITYGRCKEYGNNPTIVIDYSAQNSFGGMNREYFFFLFNDKMELFGYGEYKDITNAKTLDLKKVKK